MKIQIPSPTFNHKSYSFSRSELMEPHVSLPVDSLELSMSQDLNSTPLVAKSHDYWAKGLLIGAGVGFVGLSLGSLIFAAGALNGFRLIDEAIAFGAPLLGITLLPPAIVLGTGLGGAVDLFGR